MAAFINRMQLPSPVDPVAARFAQTSLVAWLAAAILLGVLVSLLAARRLVKPLSTLAEVVERAGVTGTATAMPASGPREIQAIIEAFNRMQGRLSRFIEDRTRMIAAISHDLRTPLTRLQLRMESPDVLAERQRMLADLHAMGEMIDSVISFAQEDTRREPRLLVDVATLVEVFVTMRLTAGPLPSPELVASRSTVVRSPCGARSATWWTMRSSMAPTPPCTWRRSPSAW